MQNHWNLYLARKQQQLYVNYRNFRETVSWGPFFERPGNFSQTRQTQNSFPGPKRFRDLRETGPTPFITDDNFENNTMKL